MRSTGSTVFRATCLIVALVGCSAPAKEEGAPRPASRGIEQVAWDSIAAGAAVIDVRTAAEFQAGHLPDAVNIPYDEIASRQAELPSDRNRAVVLYCRSGRRSGIAQQTLEGLGYSRAMNAGGYDALMRAQPR
jgi:phage shock protein E